MRETLGALGLAPRNLVLEVSERQAISNFPIFREATDHFSNVGFRIALDDTGAGFSSLEAALELSPDFLKIDMSLVRGIEESPEKQELLRGLKGVAGKMGSTLIAEGIETRARARRDPRARHRVRPGLPPGPGHADADAAASDLPTSR